MIDWLYIYLSWFMILCGIATAIALLCGLTAGYGRYSQTEDSYTLDAKTAWLIQEAPSFFVPFFFISLDTTFYGAFCAFLMGYHYYYRAFIYPKKLTSPNGSPYHIVLMAIIFCIWNGFIQGVANLRYQIEFTDCSLFRLLCIAIGTGLFFYGVQINRQSDDILRSLRGPRSKEYKIPIGGYFEYVSCANYFGEIVEWIGYAIAVQSLPAFAFALFTVSNIGPRALSHHKWYKTSFPNYPSKRKALIPFVL